MQFTTAIVAAILSFTAAAAPTTNGYTSSCINGRCTENSYNGQGTVSAQASASAQASLELNGDGLYCMPRGWKPSFQKRSPYNYNGRNDRGDWHNGHDSARVSTSADAEFDGNDGRFSASSSARASSNGRGGNDDLSVSSNAEVNGFHKRDNNDWDNRHNRHHNNNNGQGSGYNGHDTITFTVTAESESEIEVPLNGQPIKLSAQASAIAAINIPQSIAGHSYCKVSTATQASTDFEVVGRGWHKELKVDAKAEAEATITCTYR